MPLGFITCAKNYMGKLLFVLYAGVLLIFTKVCFVMILTFVAVFSILKNFLDVASDCLSGKRSISNTTCTEFTLNADNEEVEHFKTL